MKNKKIGGFYLLIWKNPKQVFIKRRENLEMLKEYAATVQQVGFSTKLGYEICKHN